MTRSDCTSPADDPRRLVFFAAAEPLFERYGYKKTTVEDICRRAGASKRTFYQLFDDKADLAGLLMLHVAGGIITDVRANVRAEMTTVEKLDVFVAAYVRLGREHRIFHLLMQDADMLASFGAHARDLRFIQLIEVLQEIIQAGVDRGELRPLDAGAATWLTYALLDSAYYLIPSYTSGQGAFDDAHFAREVRAYILHALAARGAGG